MSMMDYLRFLASLLLVLGMIGVLYYLVRRLAAQRLGSLGIGPAAGAAGRLAVVEARALDPRRRLVLVRRDDVEHLLLLGIDGDVVVERGIRPGAARFELDPADLPDPPPNGAGP